MKFYSRKFKKFYKNEGNARYHTIKDISQQNYMAECMNLTLLERTRYMFSNARLTKDFWIETMNTTCYLVNCSPATAIDCKTFFEI